jgi:hypothetical protein
LNVRVAQKQLRISENRFDRVSECVEPDRLGYIAIGTVDHAVQYIFRADVAGEHDDRERFKPGVLPQSLQEVEAAETRQPHIEEYQMRWRQLL